MLRGGGPKGFTLIELLIVIAIIGILAAIAIPMYQMKLYKAKITEVTNGMSNVASAVGAYYQDNNAWPPNNLTNVAMIQNTLGVVLATDRYISGVNITGGTGVITFTCSRTGSLNVDNNNLIMSPSLTAADGAITWSWSGGAGFPVNLIPSP